MMKYSDKYDVIVGSRYILAVEVRVEEFIENLSKYANKLAKFVTKSGINDMTTGFRIYKNSFGKN